MSSINVEYTNKEKILIILENILKMIERRGLINSWVDELKKLDFNDSKNIYEIILNNKSIYGIYMLNISLTTITSGTQLDDYLSENINIHKIIISKSISKKVAKQIYHEYQNCEFFFENEMLIDIPSNVFIPEHQMLNKEEKIELLNKFNESDLGKIFLFDMMTRYYNGKIGDIFRIIRPSIVAGHSVYYRKVINSSIDIIFP